MKMIKVYGLAGILMLSSFVTTTYATTVKGTYVDIGAGATLTQTQHNRVSGSSSQVGHAPGFDGFGAVGYGLGNGLRVEVEGAYLQSHVNRVSPQNAKGHDQVFGGLANVIYDIDLKDHFGINVPVTPYVGVGAGYLVSSYNVHGPVRNITGTQGSFGYQGIVGAAFDTGVPGLSATVDYRMIGQTMSKDSFHDGDSHFDHRFNHTFNVGLKYNFNPVKINQVTDYKPIEVNHQRTYLVFFNWDSYQLSNTANLIIDRAAENSRNSSTKIYVNGYSDSSKKHVGIIGEKYNMNLSLKRAESVTNQLIKDGIPKNNITVKGYGDVVQFVKTDNNTREALNRRVEIILE